MRALCVLIFCLAVVTDCTTGQRIVGGDAVESISQYPFMTALLGSQTGFYFSLQCGGSVINNRSVLTAAHCFVYFPFAFQWRVRVGSIHHNMNGAVASANSLILHHDYDPNTLNNDIAIIRIVGQFSFNDNVGVAQIGSYNVVDNSPVWAVGWGAHYYQGPPADELHHVQKWTINHDICRNRYTEYNYTITDNMLCSGVLDVGGSDACQGDSGGPLLHNNIIVGITSFGEDCAHSYLPGVNVRISNYISWIQDNY